MQSTGSPSRRDELVEARADIVRQLMILESGPSSIGPQGGAYIENADMIAELRSELAEVDKALAELAT